MYRQVLLHMNSLTVHQLKEERSSCIQQLEREQVIICVHFVGNSEILNLERAQFFILILSPGERELFRGNSSWKQKKQVLHLYTFIR